MQSRQQSGPRTLGELREQQEIVRTVELESIAAKKRAEEEAAAQLEAIPVPFEQLPEQKIHELTTLALEPSGSISASSGSSVVDIGGTILLVVVFVGMLFLAKRL